VLARVLIVEAPEEVLMQVSRIRRTMSSGLTLEVIRQLAVQLLGEVSEGK
jgi:hypothetical protein